MTVTPRSNFGLFVALSAVLVTGVGIAAPIAASAAAPMQQTTTPAASVLGAGSAIAPEPGSSDLAAASAVGEAAPRRPADSCPEGQFFEDGFVDVPASLVHETAIDCLVWWRVANGKNSARYGPGEGVARDAMASFVARAIGMDLSTTAPDAFTDDNNSVHQQAINHLAQAGIVGGTGDGSYSPSRTVTRGQMARFMSNAAAHVLGAPLASSQDFFDDDTAHRFERDINSTAEAGLAGGTGPRHYDPERTVSRDQMASFLSRLLDLFVENGHRQRPAPETSPRNPGDDVGCHDFRSPEEVWAYYNHYFPHFGDVANVDPDQDGQPCESMECPTTLIAHVSPEQAAICLYEAWVKGDEALAHPYASEEAERWMFQYTYEPPSWERQGCSEVEPGVLACAWYIPPTPGDGMIHGVGIDMFMGSDEQGFFVSYVESYG